MGLTAVDLILQTLRRAPASRRRRLESRLRVLAAGYGGSAQNDADIGEVINAVLHGLSGEPQIWQALAALRAVYPTVDEVIEARRVLSLDGPVAVVEPLLRWRARQILLDPGYNSDVEMVTDGLLVDLDHTAQASFFTGIQRVVRNLVREWGTVAELQLVGWTIDRKSLRRLHPRQIARVLDEDGRPPAKRDRRSRVVLVPSGGVYVLPELDFEPRAMLRLEALARFSGVRTVAIGHDCTPITMAETAPPGMPGVFSGYLSALRYFDQIITTSFAVKREFEGWKAMLGSVGIEGPSITLAGLPRVAQPSTADEIARVHALLSPDGAPVLLCVGSHEPRKNHISVLHAAELLWRDGLDFRLAFIGGNAWLSDEFSAFAAELAGKGRRVTTLSAIPDQTLWAAYRVARATVFPSLVEGYGLPVAESLASGTPVITTRFGSTAEITLGGGALLIDPRSPHDIADAMRLVIQDSSTRERLREEARRTPERSWTAYAHDVAALVAALGARS